MSEHNDPQMPTDESFLLDNGIMFDPKLNEISYNDKVVTLAHTDSRVLELLICHAGSIVPREQLIKFSWNGRVVADTSLMKSISNIRKAFKDLEISDDCVVTIPRVGYRLACRVLNNIEQQKSETPPNVHIEVDVDPGINVEDESPKKITVFIDYYQKIIKGKSFPVKLKYMLIGLSIFLLGYALYNFMWYIDQDLDNDFLRRGYEINNITISNKKYTLIRPEKLMLTDDIKPFISLAPSMTLIYIQKKDGIYNVSYSYKGKSMSFNFSENNKSTAVCRIKTILSDGEHLCVM
ncbi:winged helix-turn-helix domain-containing protein [Aeromonas sp. HMWF016]|uniref:winged helix-turn-helix domain-containing protein n=1 Tax=Aeromonas sp. HMWF016 TaxID=2056852 RepID=UPI0015E7FBA4|nr:winged helix-turn-helix domain-containing protein [Aeromonas sp. HMWF016]